MAVLFVSFGNAVLLVAAVSVGSAVWCCIWLGGDIWFGSGSGLAVLLGAAVELDCCSVIIKVGGKAGVGSENILNKCYIICPILYGLYNIAYIISAI